MRSRYVAIGLMLAFMAMIPYFNGCNKDLSPLNIASTSFAPPSPCVGISSPIGMYEDFEHPFIGAPWSPWLNGPGSTVYLRTLETAISCTHSLKLIIPAGDPGYWALYFGMSGSSLNAPSGNMSLSPASALKMWVKINQDVKFGFYWVEGTTTGGDGESWYHLLSLTKDPDWQEVTLPLDYTTFSTSGTGNHVMDTQDIDYLWFNYYDSPTPYPSHILYIDDIRFIP